LQLHHAAIGPTRDDAIRPYSPGHPEPTAKDLCPGGKTRAIFLVIPDIGNRESILVSFGRINISRRRCAGWIALTLGVVLFVMKNIRDINLEVLGGISQQSHEGDA
jgi:hypothetical protein